MTNPEEGQGEAEWIRAECLLCGHPRGDHTLYGWCAWATCTCKIDATTPAARNAAKLEARLAAAEEGLGDILQVLREPRMDHYDVFIERLARKTLAAITHPDALTEGK